MYSVKKMIKALSILPDNTEIRGWDDESIYAEINDNQFTLCEDDYTWKSYKGPKMYDEYTKDGKILVLVEK